MDKLIDRRSNHLSVHQSVRSAIRDSQQLTSPIGVLFLKLPPPPCAVLLVTYNWWISHCRVWVPEGVCHPFHDTLIVSWVSKGDPDLQDILFQEGECVFKIVLDGFGQSQSDLVDLHIFGGTKRWGILELVYQCAFIWSAYAPAASLSPEESGLSVWEKCHQITSNYVNYTKLYYINYHKLHYSTCALEIARIYSACDHLIRFQIPWGWMKTMNGLWPVTN